MSQLREQTQDNEPEEDTKEDLSEDSKEDSNEDSNEDLKEDSKEDLSKDSKEDLSEDSKEDLDEDSKEDLDEDSKEDSDEGLSEDLKEDSNEDLDEIQPFEPNHSDLRVFDPNLGDVRVNIDPSLSDLSSLDPDTSEGKELIDLDLSDAKVNIDPSLSDLGSLDPDTKEGISTESIDLDLSDARLNIDPSLSDLGSLDPDTKEGISTEPIELDLSDARVNIDPSLSDLGSLDPDTNEAKELINLDLSDARVNNDPNLSDLNSLDPETNEVKELIDLDLSDARVNIDPSLSDLGSLDPDTKEGISTEPIELDHSDINPYIDDNEGTTTSLLIKHDEESNRMSELNVRLSDMDSELASELQGDFDVQDIARDDLSKMDDISSSEFREVPVIQDVLKDELSELDGELSELEDISSYELKETPVIQDMLEDELSELDVELSELADMSLYELKETPVIQDVLEDESSELDGELSEIKDISTSDFQDSKITQDIAREEIKDELIKLDNESWNIKDIFSNEFVDLSDTQYSIEEDSLEISNVIEPLALDIANVQSRTLGQDYVGEPQIENVYEEGNENEINYDLSIDKNNQEASEQELSLIGKENGEESKEITATTSSTTSTDEKDNQEDSKEEDQTSEKKKKSEKEETSVDSEEEYEPEIDEQTENMNKEIPEIPEDFFYKVNLKEVYHCKDINLLKKIYEIQKSFLKIELYLKNQDCKNIPGSSTLRRLVQKSFKFKSEYDTWKRDIWLKEIQDIAKKEGGECLSLEYKGMHTKLRFRCKEGHEFEAFPKNVKHKNSWCPMCVNVKKLTLKEFQDSKKGSENLNKEIESKYLEGLIDKTIEEFKILKDPKLKEIIKIHDGDTYKGSHFTKKFIKFIKDQDNNVLTKEEKDNLVKRIDEFNENKNINNVLKYYVKYTNLSQPKILKKLEDMNLKITKLTLINILHKILTREVYKKRFPKPEDWVSDEQREGIIKAGRSKNPGSLNDIGDEFGVSYGTVRDIIKKDLGEKVYHKKFPKPEVSDEQREGIIRDGRSKNPDSIPKIAAKWGVSITSAVNIIQDDLGEKVYHKKFPKPEDCVSDEQREGIIRDGRSKNPDSIGNIAIKWKVGYNTAVKIIRNDLGEKEFNKKFHNDIPQLIGFENHRLIEKIATQDFDEKRKKFPDVPILISEPPIYTNSKKCCDNAFKNDKKYLQKLLKDRIAKELKIDPKKLDHIKVALFDYTSWFHKANIMDKIEKYQHSKIMLFIVGTHWFQSWVSRVKKLPKDKRIKYPENIRIIKWDLFADLLNLSDDNRKQLKEIIGLSRLKDLETLRKLNEQNNYKLHRLKKSKTKRKGSKNDLDAFLKKI